MGGSLLTAWMAFRGFDVVEDVLRAPSPQFEEIQKPVGHESTRLLLRFQVAELNREMAHDWGVAQLIFAVSTLLLILFATSEGRPTLIIAAVVLLIVAIQQFALMPRIVGLGRLLDFLPPDQALADRGELRALSVMYTGSEILKLLVGGVLVWQLFRAKRRSSSKLID